jgi:O-antigen/teichoic acid export membrane protein
MSLLKTNVIANFSGRFVGAVLSLIFVPVYVGILGVESYGLIGVFVSLQAAFFLLDMGLSTTLNRELARRNGVPGMAQEARDLVRSLEYVYWLLAGVIAATGAVLADFIAGYWVNVETLERETVRQAVVVMGMVIASQLPLKLYQGGLAGLQKQLLVNVLETVLLVFRLGGAALILWFVSPTIQAYFLWQLFAAVVSVIVMGCSLWRNLAPTGVRSRFQKGLLESVWRFAAGLTGISLSVFLLMQVDKILLSRMISLKEFGYYSLATSAALTLTRFIGPIYNASFPRLTQLANVGNEGELTILYHKCCQLMAAVILPVGSICIVFRSEILMAWIADADIVYNTATIFGLLVAGTTLNGLVNIPYALQLANGWTSLGFYVNLGALVIIIPMMIALVLLYGAIGGAVAWLVLNSGYILIAVRLMHRRLLKDEMWSWYICDVGKPLVVSLAAAALLFWLMPAGLSRVMTLVYLGCSFLVASCATGMSVSAVRIWTAKMFLGLSAHYR